ncbi:uncharacterized protein LOC134336280 [Trichomycterus rosablanca]|uniref:uncharacterized protein LOC134336280 n=1 Tax=Trichomycterus rosablanca TaxID=2290929 RepID=UPI002F359B45
MSALVDEAIKLYKAEELRLTETIRQYKELIRSMKTRVQGNDEEVPINIKDNEIPLKERQEIELLEQALKKALKVRSSSAVSKAPGAACQEEDHSNASLNKAAINGAGKDTRKTKQQMLSSTEVKKCHQRGNHTLHSRVKTRPTVNGKQLATKLLPVQKNPEADSQKKPGYKESDGLNTPSQKEQTSQSDQESKVQWVPSPLIPLWQGQRAKKYRLWNKVLTRHTKPVPERDQFRKRLASTFPTDWPSVHTAVMEAELDVITQLALDLTHCYNAELQNLRLASDPETSMEREYESLLMLAGLEEMMTKVIKHASHLKKDWETRLAWWHGSLCPLRSTNKWSDQERCLPSLLVYSSEGDLAELLAERLHIDHLQLEIRLHQAMCDTLVDLDPCEASAVCPSATVLRGVYSLLAEGSAYFPSLVLDTEPAQT